VRFGLVALLLIVATLAQRVVGQAQLSLVFGGLVEGLQANPLIAIALGCLLAWGFGACAFHSPLEGTE
jgi:hypothetical protein